MTVSGNDDNNLKQDAHKRKTISLNKGDSSVFVGPKASSKTVRVEVKKRKTANIKLDVTNSSRGEVSEKSKESDILNDKNSTGKLTNREFMNRVKVLQEAMKNEQTQSIENSTPEAGHNDLYSQIVTEENREPEKAEVNPSQVERPDSSPAVEATRDSQRVASKSQPYKRKATDTFASVGKPIVFKASEYASPRHKQAVVDPSVEITDNIKRDNVKFKKVVETVEEKKKAKVTKVFPKKTEAGKKVSRAVLHRVMDNDLEERTRSVAAFKRAKQKLKGWIDQQEAVKVVREVNIPDMITVSELANRMAVRGADVVKYLMRIGTMATLNQSIDGDTAEVICTEFGHTPKRVSESDVENEIENIIDDPKSLKHRAPIVAIMGHVDHGKTTLLDTIRKTSVATKEAGGITQHVAAYQIETQNRKKITFIDTPGHAAFSKIRSRGAVITDVVVLVVAADDGIKDQTIEAIAHAKLQNVPIVVAINKIDKPHVNIDRIKTDLMNHEIILEDFGGEILSSEISALKNINLDGLLETILLQAEMLQLSANPDRKAVGTILESRMAKGKGIVSSVIIQSGTLKDGDIFVAGASYGRVRSIYDDAGRRISSAGPSMPIEVVGFNTAPEPGESIVVMESEQKAREVAEYRQRVMKEKANSSTIKTMDQLIAGQNSDTHDLNLLIKSDVYGSAEALVASIEAINHDEIDIKITESGVGMINESDVDFAKNTKSIIVGFNVGITAAAKESSKQNNVVIYNNSVIYHIIEQIKAKMSELLPPVVEENYIGNADVRKIFVISRYGTIAGCYVTDGLMKRGDSKIKVMRNGECVFTGKIRSMKHEKDEIKESKQSHECGILAEGFNDFKEGDQIECFEIVQKARFVE